MCFFSVTRNKRNGISFINQLYSRIYLPLFLRPVLLLFSG
ncbi:hypothetical protein COPCOM_00272 [Coprococcus comes ATCC 27758]|uniref:Uncharacterized protein n=1 Tax=Coprococcus comes ATCC 27758 TaxID=470146 RepID=C0B552_9FIRM|nr:hypothetical protein COPCOM_00272 [Coprococcus comes ATCC 27758]